MHRDFRFETEYALREFASDFALALRSGDCVLLKGELGAGKTTFARAAIRTLAGDTDGTLEVPSPTFTLVQNYALRFPVAHFDLYRIGDPEELDELGLGEALENGVAFVEWPEKAGGRLPDDAVVLEIVEDTRHPDIRIIDMTARGSFLDRFDRSHAIRYFLNEHGCRDATRTFLLGDASTRAYETVTSPGGKTAILMDAPRRPDGPPVKDGLPYSRIAHLAEDVTPFVANAHALRDNGFRAPQIYACDLDPGFVLLEHLGSDTILDADGAPDPQRYGAAVETIAAMHEASWPREIAVPGGSHRIPAFDLDAFMIEAELLADWFVPRVSGKPLGPAARARFQELWAELFAVVDQAEKTLVLRDFHSPNIIWDSSARGTDRVCLIDFQDALYGPGAYDIASLAQDARVDISPALESELVSRYCSSRAAVTFDEEGFRRAFAILSAQRATKILGIFVRLDERDGKPGYLRHIPRLQGYLRRSFAHPSLAGLRSWYEEQGILDARIEARR